MAGRLTINHFDARLDLIGTNPFVLVPDEILAKLCDGSGAGGPIPVRGEVNGKAYQQTLVRFRGAWRTSMLADSPRRIGERIHVAVEYDPSDRTIEPHPRLLAALAASPQARQAFESLPPSTRKEIVRYLARLKSDTSIDRNVERAIRFLLGQERFLGRDPIDPC